MKKLARLIPAALALALASGTALADSQTLPFQTSAQGTEPGGLSFCGSTCVTGQMVGTATSTHLGTGAWSSTLTVDLSGIHPVDDSGTYCAPATGSASLTAANGDIVYFSYSGSVCEVGLALFGIPHTFSGTYTITGGTGRFDGAGGTGSITAGDDGAGNAYMSDTGTITY